jgi:hypothetical protein
MNVGEGEDGCLTLEKICWRMGRSIESFEARDSYVEAVNGTKEASVVYDRYSCWTNDKSLFTY